MSNKVPMRPSSRRDFLTGRGPALARPIAPDVDGAPASRPPIAERVLNRFSRPAMGCWFEFFVDPERHRAGPDVCQDSLDLVERLERDLSTYRSDSELSDVNRRGAEEIVTVSKDLAEVLSLSLELHRETGGAFDVTSGPLSKVWGFYQRKPIVPSDAAIAEALSRTGSHHIDWKSNQRTIRFRKPGIEINLASIGKGYALDRCGVQMLESGVSDFILHAGQSSVLAHGGQDPADPNRGWAVGVLHPVLPHQRLGTVQLVDRGLGTSGSQRQSLIHKGDRLGHVIDPRTGRPVSHTLSATVLAPSAALADALATAFCVMNIQEVRQFLAQRSNIGAIIVTPSTNANDLVTVHAVNLDETVWRPSEILTAAQSIPREQNQGI